MSIDALCENSVTFRTLTLMILFWVIVFVFNLAGFVSSRRQANLGYVLWIAAMAMSFLSFCIIGDQLRCMMSITTPLLINVLNKTQLPGKFSRFRHLFTPYFLFTN